MGPGRNEPIVRHLQQTNPSLPPEFSAQNGSEIAVHFSVAPQEKKEKEYHAIEESNGQKSSSWSKRWRETPS